MFSGLTKRCEPEIPYREGAGAGGWGARDELVGNEQGEWCEGCAGELWVISGCR